MWWSSTCNIVVIPEDTKTEDFSNSNPKTYSEDFGCHNNHNFECPLSVSQSLSHFFYYINNNHGAVFTNQRNIVNHLIKRAKIDFYEEKIQKCGNEQKAVFGIVKVLLGINFFLDKIDKIYQV